jgi:copper oxidase (laccase) domain-containing protein
VTERSDDAVPALVHAGWEDRFPWLVQGTTTRGPAEDPFDLGFFAGVSTEGLVWQHFERLLAATGMTGVALARQVHEADVRSHADVRPGLTVAAPCDGHATDSAGLLLTVTVADSVPVFMEPARRRERERPQPAQRRGQLPGDQHRDRQRQPAHRLQHPRGPGHHNVAQIRS